MLAAAADAVQAYAVPAGGGAAVRAGPAGAPVGPLPAVEAGALSLGDLVRETVDSTATYFTRKEERLRALAEKKADSKRVCLDSGAAAE